MCPNKEILSIKLRICSYQSVLTYVLGAGKNRLKVISRSVLNTEIPFL